VVVGGWAQDFVCLHSWSRILSKVLHQSAAGVCSACAVELAGREREKGWGGSWVRSQTEEDRHAVQVKHG